VDGDLLDPPGFYPLTEERVKNTTFNAESADGAAKHPGET